METKIEIVTGWSLPRLIEELEHGRIKVPMFQRDYQWEKSKIVLLLNSIYLQYPIGTFFLWIAPSAYNTFIRSIDDIQTHSDDNGNQFQFILDGQQRLLSLFRASRGLSSDGVDYTQICFNPARKKFKIPRVKSEKYNFPAYCLFNESLFKEVELQLDADSTRIADNWRKARKLMMEYPVSVVKTLNYEIDDVVEIFERINQGGKRLSSFDLIHATTWSTDFDLKERMRDFNAMQKVAKLGVVSDKVFTYALAMNAFDDCKSSSQLKLNPETAKTLWPRTRKALSFAIDFIIDMAITTDISTYQTHIIVLQYYFFQSAKNSIPKEHRKSVEKWFWDARFAKRYSSLTHTRIKEDAVWLVEMLSNLEKTSRK
ncbi:MAG: DUF262 domain-containing protein [Salinivirgaceae bacterium]|nr:DUF262 domain-containing protein [Salinivirgaceae bacterium]